MFGFTLNSTVFSKYPLPATEAVSPVNPVVGFVGNPFVEVLLFGKYALALTECFPILSKETVSLISLFPFR